MNLSIKVTRTLEFLSKQKLYEAKRMLTFLATNSACRIPTACPVASGRSFLEGPEVFLRLLIWSSQMPPS